jgi:hypothetical protein
MLYDSGVDDPGFDLNVTENSSALDERLSSCGFGGVRKLVTLMDRQMDSFVVGLYTLHVNWMVGYQTLSYFD